MSTTDPTDKAAAAIAASRTRKALALLHTLRLCFPEALPAGPLLAVVPDSWRRKLADISGVNFPSDYTWEIVVHLAVDTCVTVPMDRIPDLPDHAPIAPPPTPSYSGHRPDPTDPFAGL
jgi:hypothetical protein